MTNLKTAWKKYLALRSQGNALWSQGDALRSQGYALWEKAAAGKTVVWNGWNRCTVDGVEYKPAEPGKEGE